MAATEARRWCVPDSASVAAYGAASEEGCMKAVRDGAADATSLGPVAVYRASQFYELQPIATEQFGEAAGGSEPVTRVGAVALVRRSLCESPPRRRGTAATRSGHRRELEVADLEGLTACFAAYGSLAGWAIPVGLLLDANVLPTNTTDTEAAGASGLVPPGDAAAAAAFFSKACSPSFLPGLTYCNNVDWRTREEVGEGGRRGGGMRREWGALQITPGLADWPTLFTSLVGAGRSKASSDAARSEDTALYCLRDGGGEVAFVETGSYAHFIDSLPPGRARNAILKADLMQLCFAGGCRELDDPDPCP
eukprot:SM002907S11267  [mRNA]  locus=s2907:144:1410:- [translate_table: standard]